ncbi:hypothetical protein M422DRAFT_776205 [Sphaerobolus stellatus SS14]|nr:hypothetical protein M422DRAFT_776205 [Sphaerobolus stellatus SS14]
MGVKQLWTLLGPVGRPVLLETMEGKTMAIDSSIWIYQFQATMRDKDGRALVNAHVLGFLRRICKLLFYGIKPVFVFDGGAPALKRQTITERKRKKAGAAETHVRVAEKLLAAQMRREALSHVQKKTQGSASAAITDDTIYLEDLENNTPQATPSKSKGKGKATGPATPDAASVSASKKAKFQDHDPYRLPEMDLTDIAKPTSSLAPDPRLATEEELHLFIEAMRPEDLDVTNPAFRELPTEVQYEIIGDLRLKSRQTSHKRLQTMLKNSRTPMDFSKAQIRNLQQRNTLTQQLLVTTDSISKANVVIPIRIASERNKEYVLIKNQGEEGGWVLGIRNEGTQDKPIVIDEEIKDEEDEEDSDVEMEEVPIAQAATPDPDLRDYQGRMALAAISRRQPPPNRPIPRPSTSTALAPTKKSKVPLFIDEDADLEAAITASLKEQEEEQLRKALEESQQDNPEDTRLEYDDDDLYEAAPSRLDTALAIANTPNRRTLTTPSEASASMGASGSMFGTPTLLLGGDSRTSTPTTPTKMTPTKLSSPTKVSTPAKMSDILTNEDMGEESEEDLEEVPVQPEPIFRRAISVVDEPPTVGDSDEDLYEEVVPLAGAGTRSTRGAVSQVIETVEDSDDDLYEVSPVVGASTNSARGVTSQVSAVMDSRKTIPFGDDPVTVSAREIPKQKTADSTAVSSKDHEVTAIFSEASSSKASLAPSSSTLHAPPQRSPKRVTIQDIPSEDEDEPLEDWERSSSPIPDPFQPESSTQGKKDNQTAQDEHWDAAQEMNIIAEEGDFAQFVSQMKGQDLDAARQEIDEEIRDLNKQKKVAMRDSEDITQHMISQIMLLLRLFGIPYITAPMEAEAQCATLVSLGLVEGVITDDSDVFLFGGLRVFKNMFNQSKTVECFLLSDLSRELGLDRDRLIRLAYLLGSDYVDGLPGVGPVVAMEILREFPGEDGLFKFREWWRKVQSGKDTEEESKTTFRRKFKKRFKNLYLPEDWPNPIVRDAYYHPTVNESEEPFKWGLPDLDALHQFLQEELGWSQNKVDDLLVPIIRQMGQREKNASANRQGTLDNYFDVSLGGGNYAPRKKQAYSSKRLQQVVADFRAKQKRGVSASEEEPAAKADPPTRKRKARSESKATGTGKRGKGGKTSVGKGRKKHDANSSSEFSGDEHQDTDIPETSEAIPPPALAAKLRPRPKPRYKEPRAEGEAEGEEKGDTDDEFIVKRQRRKL